MRRLGYTICYFLCSFLLIGCNDSESTKSSSEDNLGWLIYVIIGVLSVLVLFLISTSGKKKRKRTTTSLGIKIHSSSRTQKIPDSEFLKPPTSNKGGASTVHKPPTPIKEELSASTIELDERNNKPELLPVAHELKPEPEIIKRYFIPTVDKFVLVSDTEDQPVNFYFSLCLIYTEGSQTATLDLSLNHSPQVVSLSKTLMQLNDDIAFYIDINGSGKSSLNVQKQGKMVLKEGRWILSEKIKASLT